MTTFQPTTAAANTMTKLPTPSASELLYADDTSSKRLYWDRSFYESIDAQKEALAKSASLYVGNLAFSTRTAHIRSHFSLVGKVKQIHMGLDRIKKTPCGFCFVEYYDRASALSAIANLSGSKLDGRVIRVELDAGFHPGRQYGRGKTGGQVRDEKRETGRRTAAEMAGSKRDRDNSSNDVTNNMNNAGVQEGGEDSESMELPSNKRQRLNEDVDKSKW